MKISKWLAVLMLFVSACCSCAGADKKEMKASKIVALAKKGKPVHVVNKIIFGDLDFTACGKPFILNANKLQCDIESNLFFEQCVFMGKVTSNGRLEKTPIQSCFRNHVIFTGCDFRGEVDFSEAIVFGMVNFGRSVFREKVKFNHIAVWAKHSFFSEMKAEKDFSMIDAAFAGSLNFFGATFQGNAFFQESSIKGKLLFNNATFMERAGFDIIQVWENAFFNYATFEKTADFSWSRFMGLAEFANVNFAKEANFENTYFQFKMTE